MSESPIRKGDPLFTTSDVPNPGPAVSDLPAVPRYQILDEMARGGMGVVYRASDAVLGREVAVKVLHDHFGSTSAAARRFADEARIAAQLQHPSVPPVHDLGTLPDGRPFLAMKLIKGQTLDELLKARPDPAHDRGRFVAVFEQVCQAIGYAHAHQVIHRDLKPANVMVGSFGEVQVMDWGLAKLLASREVTLPEEPADPEATTAETAIRSARDGSDATRAGSMLGTPAYMPPEQAIGAVDQIDPRSDVFGLGAVLCAILTGQPPYLGADSESTRQLAARAKLDDAFGRLDGCGAEPDLVALCKRCLAVEKAERPADAGEVAQAVAGLRAAADERARQAELQRARAEAEAREQRRRRRVQLGLAVAVGLLLVAGAAFAWWQDRLVAEQRQRLGRNADALAALLAGCADALRAGDADRAEGLLGEADRRMTEGGGDELQDRLDRCRADLAVARDLDAIDQFRWTPVDGKSPDPKEVAARFRAALAQFGVVPGETLADEAARRVNGSMVRDRLVAALDRWLHTEHSADVRTVLRAADPDGYRDAVRDAILAGDRVRVAELVGRAEALTQPTRFVAFIGESGTVTVKRRRELLQAALVRRPGDLGLLMALGWTYPTVRSDEAKDQVRWFQAAVSVAPGNSTAHNSLGGALWAAGDLDGAITAYREAIRIDRQYALAHNNLGIALRDKNDLDGAITEYREAIRLDPNFASPHHVLGNALYARGDVDGAIAEYRKAIRLNPRYVMALYNLGIALGSKGDLDGAIAEYRKVIVLTPKEADAYVNLGVALRRKGDLDEAIAVHREAIRLDPKSSFAQYSLGIALWMKRDFDAATAAYREASRVDPQHAYSHDALGIILIEVRGDVDGAVSEFRIAVKLEPKNTGFKANLAQAERWQELLPRLPDVVAGRAEPKTPAEAVDFAEICGKLFQKRYVLAVRLYRNAFAADPKLADDLAAGHRYSAACCAARAAAGKGKDEEPLSSADRAALRTQALGWLRANLVLWQKQTAASPTERQQAAAKLSQWLRDTDLAGLRPGADREGWSKEEVADWDRFWSDVRATLAEANKPPPKSVPPEP